MTIVNLATIVDGLRKRGIAAKVDNTGGNGRSIMLGAVRDGRYEALCGPGFRTAPLSADVAPHDRGDTADLCIGSDGDDWGPFASFGPHDTVEVVTEAIAWYLLAYGHSEAD